MSAELLKTPLHALHVEHGARMVPFAGYDMPVNYPGGIIAEHKQCRDSAALFDVSHMGQLRLVGDDAARALESLVPVDVLGLAVGQQRYAFFTEASGGILDDLMITRRENDLLLVVNAGCKAQDIQHLITHIGHRCQVTPLPERALLALQGPKAAEALAHLNPGVTKLLFMTGGSFKLAGADCYVTRSGYTGEDGFEISVPEESAVVLARALGNLPEVKPAGLGARDTLRLEAGLCLYGHDIDTRTSPVQAGVDLGHPEGAPPRRRACRSLPRRRRHRRPIGRRRQPQARRPGGAGARARARRRPALRCAWPQARHGHQRHARPHGQQADRHGLPECRTRAATA